MEAGKRATSPTENRRSPHAKKIEGRTKDNDTDAHADDDSAQGPADGPVRYGHAGVRCARLLVRELDLAFQPSRVLAIVGSAPSKPNQDAKQNTAKGGHAEGEQAPDGDTAGVPLNLLLSKFCKTLIDNEHPGRKLCSAALSL